MPIFEFTCKACGKTFEEIMSNSSHTKVKCPECGSGKVQKILSPTLISSGGTSQSTSSCGSSRGFS